MSDIRRPVSPFTINSAATARVDQQNKGSTTSTTSPTVSGIHISTQSMGTLYAPLQVAFNEHGFISPPTDLQDLQLPSTQAIAASLRLPYAGGYYQQVPTPSARFQSSTYSIPPPFQPSSSYLNYLSSGTEFTHHPSRTSSDALSPAQAAYLTTSTGAIPSNPSTSDLAATSEIAPPMELSPSQLAYLSNMEQGQPTSFSYPPLPNMSPNRDYSFGLSSMGSYDTSQPPYSPEPQPYSLYHQENYPNFVYDTVLKSFNDKSLLDNLVLNQTLNIADTEGKTHKDAHNLAMQRMESALVLEHFRRYQSSAGYPQTSLSRLYNVREALTPSVSNQQKFMPIRDTPTSHPADGRPSTKEIITENSRSSTPRSSFSFDSLLMGEDEFETSSYHSMQDAVNPTVQELRQNYQPLEQDKYPLGWFFGMTTANLPRLFHDPNNHENPILHPRNESAYQEVFEDLIAASASNIDEQTVEHLGEYLIILYEHGLLTIKEMADAIESLQRNNHMSDEPNEMPERLREFLIATQPHWWQLAVRYLNAPLIDEDDRFVVAFNEDDYQIWNNLADDLQQADTLEARQNIIKTVNVQLSNGQYIALPRLTQLQTFDDEEQETSDEFTNSPVPTGQLPIWKRVIENSQGKAPFLIAPQDPSQDSWEVPDGTENKEAWEQLLLEVGDQMTDNELKQKLRSLDLTPPLLTILDKIPADPTRTAQPSFWHAVTNYIPNLPRLEVKTDSATNQHYWDLSDTVVENRQAWIDLYNQLAKAKINEYNVIIRASGLATIGRTQARTQPNYWQSALELNIGLPKLITVQRIDNGKIEFHLPIGASQLARQTFSSIINALLPTASAQDQQEKARSILRQLGLAVNLENKKPRRPSLLPIIPEEDENHDDETKGNARANETAVLEREARKKQLETQPNTLLKKLKTDYLDLIRKGKFLRRSLGESGNRSLKSLFGIELGKHTEKQDVASTEYYNVPGNAFHGLPLTTPVRQLGGDEYLRHVDGWQFAMTDARFPPLVANPIGDNLPPVVGPAHAELSPHLTRLAMLSPPSNMISTPDHQCSYLTYLLETGFMSVAEVMHSLSTLNIKANDELSEAILATQHPRWCMAIDYLAASPMIESSEDGELELPHDLSNRDKWIQLWNDLRTAADHEAAITVLAVSPLNDDGQGNKFINLADANTQKKLSSYAKRQEKISYYQPPIALQLKLEASKAAKASKQELIDEHNPAWIAAVKFANFPLMTDADDGKLELPHGYEDLTVVGRQLLSLAPADGNETNTHYSNYLITLYEHGYLSINQLLNAINRHKIIPNRELTELLVSTQPPRWRMAVQFLGAPYMLDTAAKEVGLTTEAEQTWGDLRSALDEAADGEVCKALILNHPKAKAGGRYKFNPTQLQTYSFQPRLVRERAPLWEHLQQKQSEL